MSRTRGSSSSSNAALRYSAAKIRVLPEPSKNGFVVIRQGLAGDLSSCNASSVSKTGHEERVNVAIALKAVQHGSDAFVEKGHCSHLNADYSTGDLNLRKS